MADLMAECIVCAQPISDTALVCRRCTDALRDRLVGTEHKDKRRQTLGMVDLWADLEDTITRQVRIGDPTPRAGRPAPAQAARPGATDIDHQNGWPTGLPVDLAASNVGDTVRNTLTTWARVVAEHTGADPPSGMAELTVWLAGRCDWARYQKWVAEWHDELWYAAGLMSRAIDRAPARRYLGPCMEPDGLTGQCPGDLYARAGSDTVRCPGCGTVHSVADRKQWLDGLVLDYTYTATEIAAAYPVVKANTIRQWASRGQLAAHGADRHSRPLYLLGDVLTLAQSSTRRREARAV